MTETVGISYASILTELVSEPSIAYGWRIATWQEFTTLVTHAGGTPGLNSFGEDFYFSFDPINDDIAPPLMSLLGITSDTSHHDPYAYTWGYIDAGELNYHWVPSFNMVTALTNTAGLSINVPISDGTRQTFIESIVEGPWAHDTPDDVGTFLVRNTASIPEPSTILLLGSALTGLVFYRRKKADVVQN